AIVALEEWHRARSWPHACLRRSPASVCQREVFKMELLVAVARILEKPLEEIADQPGLDLVVIVLADTAKADQPGHAQPGEMVADGRLRRLQEIAQGADVHFPILAQRDQNLQTRLIRQQFEDVDESLDRAV